MAGCWPDLSPATLPPLRRASSGGKGRRVVPGAAASKRFLGLLACAVILCGGAAVVFAWTLGFSAFTSYSYALSAAGPLPRPAPDFAFVDQFGHERRLASLKGRRVLLHAFYGSCVTVCPIVIEQLHDIYGELNPEQRRGLVILSISVDSTRDTTGRLADLWREAGASDGWIMARPADGSLDTVLRKFGIWVFARADGTINHSADLFLIDPSGRIVRVLSPRADSEGTRRELEKYL